MTQEDKELLLKDLCGRLPYGVICRFTDTFDGCEVDNVLHPDDITDMFRHRSHCDSRIDVKPYLRQMSSMTEEEMKEYHKTFRAEPYGSGIGWVYVESIYSFDWLNKHGFDYRGLIPKGLVLEAPEGMYNNKR